MVNSHSLAAYKTQKHVSFHTFRTNTNCVCVGVGVGGWVWSNCEADQGFALGSFQLGGTLYSWGGCGGCEGLPCGVCGQTGEISCTDLLRSAHFFCGWKLWLRGWLLEDVAPPAFGSLTCYWTLPYYVALRCPWVLTQNQQHNRSCVSGCLTWWRVRSSRGLLLIKVLEILEMMRKLIKVKRWLWYVLKLVLSVLKCLTVCVLPLFLSHIVKMSVTFTSSSKAQRFLAAFWGNCISYVSYVLPCSTFSVGLQTKLFNSPAW